MDGALGMPRHFAHYHHENRRGRPKAAPAGFALSLVLHIAVILAVTLIWKAAAPIPVTEVTLVDVTRQAAGEPVKALPERQEAASPKAAPEHPARVKVHEKSPEAPVAEPVSPPAPAAKPAPEEASAAEAVAGKAAEAAAPAGEYAETGVTRESGPEVAATTGVTVHTEAAAQGTADSGAVDGTQSAGDIASLTRSYTDMLRELIARYVKYPVFARKARLEGTCMVSCRLIASGEVTDIKVAKSSGHELLDKAALTAVRDTGRFPPPPECLCGGGLEVRVPVRFSLTDR